MSNLSALLERNQAFAASKRHVGMGILPKQPVFVITCLDPRVDPAAFLGVELGDAPVIRNAGGRVTDAVIDDIAFISYLAESMVADGPLFEVAVIHHTGCGTGFLADQTFRAAFAHRAHLDEDDLAAEAVIDPDHTVTVDVASLLASPKVSPRISVAGYVYDLDTGLVRLVVPPAAPAAAAREEQPRATQW
jgi:carbonic anhydrase